jgi:hypothetical protein
MGLIGLVTFLFGQIQLLNYRLTEEQQDIDALKIQVQEKQEIQIQQLNQAVQEEHNFTVSTLAGTFTLLTCLISMFHMSSHVRNYTSPFVQRKIVAILWMSPIYSVTSFVSLLVPSLEGYLAVLKDFYESYCIYTFLSFLIAVLGRDGDRSVVVDVLAKHAAHLERPSRFLNRFYHPPPESSDRALANAVITECQIMCLQFVFLRPLTSILYYAVYYSGEQQQEQQDSYYYTNGTLIGDNNGTSTDGGGGGGGLHRYLALINGTNSSSSSSSTPNYYGGTANVTTVGGGSFAATGDAGFGDPSSSGSSAFQEETLAYFTSVYFVLDMIVNISVFFAFTGLLKFYHAVRDDLKWCKPFSKFLTIKGVVFLTFWQGLAISIVVNLKSKNNNNDNNNGIDNEYDTTTTPQNPTEQAAQLQNILICLEMLFFSITHWWVFPAEEWEPNYQPRVVAKPGMGLSDFVSDVSQIVHARHYAGHASHHRNSSSSNSNSGASAGTGTGTASGRSIQPKLRLLRFRRGARGGGGGRGARLGGLRFDGHGAYQDAGYLAQMTPPTSALEQNEDDDTELEEAYDNDLALDENVVVEEGYYIQDGEYIEQGGGRLPGPPSPQHRQQLQKQQQQQGILDDNATGYDEVDFEQERTVPELQ